MSNRTIHGYITIGILTGSLVLSGVWYATSPTTETNASPSTPVVKEQAPLYAGNYVVVHLEKMQIELHNGTSTLETVPIISIGKPGSYYETIGGAYANDYKIRNHFSSIGHVYMPSSVHVFGNYFIHGIPYYPDGIEVSSTYSGGCIRLSNEHAERVYAFIQKGTPIVITDGNERDFIATETESPSISSIEMTRLMVATISLEVLTQDNEITDTDSVSLTTRRKLLPRLLVDGDDSISKKLAQALGEGAYVSYMNQKAQALGLANTTFTSVTGSVTTTPADQERFMQHIASYKTYLLTLPPVTP